MITVTPALAPLLVAAIRDAIKYNNGLLNSETIKDATEIEEYLLSLGTLEMDVRKQYEKLAKGREDMPPYETLWR